MVYKKIVEGIFISRPNRFIARVTVCGKEETVHVKNTGRCRELLVPGTKVFLEDFDGRMGSRKLRYSLVAVEKICGGGMTKLINMDSQAPNKVVAEWLSEQDYDFVKPEFVFGKSRIDFYMERGSEKFLMEVKGCTLENHGHCLFPDAPTERGVKHLEELVSAKKLGFNAKVMILVQMEEVLDFAPNDQTHREFGEAMRNAAKEGVEILCRNCHVTPESLAIGKEVPVIL